MIKEFCFCTLAIGKRYRAHARMLAQDIREQAPNVSFIILTDQPAEFMEYTHVIAIKHRLQSVKGYHDKLFVIKKAFESFDTCIFLDSDVRIIGPVPERLDWLPGITARTGCNILKHNSRKSQSKALPIIQHIAKKLDINLEKTKWFHEFMFTVKKQGGTEMNFLNLWQTISYFFEVQGFHAGEGNAMGLAAAKTGLMIRFDSEDKFPCFKDNIEKVRIKHGQSNIKDKNIYFETHKKIEYPKRPFWKKAIDKLTKKAVFLYRFLRVRYLANKDIEFKKLL